MIDKLDHELNVRFEVLASLQREIDTKYGELNRLYKDIFDIQSRLKWYRHYYEQGGENHP